MYKTFRAKKVLITGGLGFIGSNLAIRLAGLGARVTIIDSMIPDYGGNRFNIKPVEHKVEVHIEDIRDEKVMSMLVKGKDYVFHLAGQVCHVMSLTNPFPDIDINIKGTAIVMEACKHHNRQAKVIYTGTRGEYGPATRLPVNEKAPTNPKGIYEISNLTAEHIVKVYNDIHGIRSVMLRLTNTYGERAQMRHSRFGVVNWFIRQVIDRDVIKVFGDGNIIRDFLYVQDAVDAILMAAARDEAIGEVFNVGIDKPTTFLELARLLVRIAGTGRWTFAPFSHERKVQEPGHFYSDISKIRKRVGWYPKTSLEEGLRRTIDYYRVNKQHYW